MKSFALRRPVLAFYLLTFAVSWGLFLMVGGSDFTKGADWESNPAFALAILAMLTGPTIASLLLTWQEGGRPALKQLLGQLTVWHVSVLWYAVALVVAPTIVLLVLLSLSLASSVFLPPIVAEGAEVTALLSAFGVAFTTLLEELGWTGFVIPRLRLRKSVFKTGLIVGALWGIWHLLQVTWVARVSHAEVPLAIYLLLYFGASLASLTAYRILMVWVHDRTDSLLVVTLMHGSYAASTLPFLLPVLTGTDFLVYFWLFSAALWLVVVSVGLINRREVYEMPSLIPASERGLAGPVELTGFSNRESQRQTVR